MALENDVIVAKLKTEGINEKLATGLNFETEDELSTWASEFKSSIPEPKKGLDEYTEEEIKKIADEGENKVLQGLFDKIRTEASNKKKEETPPKPGEEKPQWAKDLEQKIDNQQKTLDDQKKTKEDGDKKADAIKLIKTTHKIDGEADINIVLMKLNGDFSEANIKKQSEEHIAYLTSKGLEHVPKKSDEKSMGELEKATKEFVTKKNKQKGKGEKK